MESCKFCLVIRLYLHTHNLTNTISPKPIINFTQNFATFLDTGLSRSCFISFQINSTVVTIDSSVSPVHGFEYDRAGIFTFQQNLAALIGFTLPLWTGNPGYNTQFDGDQGWWVSNTVFPNQDSLECLQGYCKKSILAKKDIVNRILSDNFFYLIFGLIKFTEKWFESLRDLLTSLMEGLAHW